MRRDDPLDISDVTDESGIRRWLQSFDGRDWSPTGRYFVLDENSAPYLEVSYRDGILHGPYVFYWTNGKVSSEGQYKEGKPDGIWHHYKEDGNIEVIIQFEEGKEIDSSQYIYDETGKLIDIIHLHDFKKKEGKSKGGKIN